MKKRIKIIQANFPRTGYAVKLNNGNYRVKWHGGEYEDLDKDKLTHNTKYDFMYYDEDGASPG